MNNESRNNEHEGEVAEQMTLENYIQSVMSLCAICLGEGYTVEKGKTVDCLCIKQADKAFFEGEHPAIENPRLL